jgi:hypothetical protein
VYLCASEEGAHRAKAWYYNLKKEIYGGLPPTPKPDSSMDLLDGVEFPLFCSYDRFLRILDYNLQEPLIHKQNYQIIKELE